MSFFSFFFFFQAEDGIRDVAVTGVQTCALPISFATVQMPVIREQLIATGKLRWRFRDFPLPSHQYSRYAARSEEHTSELQSRLHLVCRLLLEKKKQRKPARQVETLRTGSNEHTCMQSA